jgi:hypothetical protein
MRYRHLPTRSDMGLARYAAQTPLKSKAITVSRSVVWQRAGLANDREEQASTFFRDLDSRATLKAETLKPCTRQSNVRDDLLTTPICAAHAKE